MAPDTPTPEPRRTNKGGDDELAGTVLMSGDQVVWAGPSAVLGQQADDDEGDGEDVIATGEDYTPPGQ